MPGFFDFCQENQRKTGNVTFRPRTCNYLNLKNVTAKNPLTTNNNSCISPSGGGQDPVRPAGSAAPYIPEPCGETIPGDKSGRMCLPLNKKCAARSRTRKAPAPLLRHNFSFPCRYAKIGACVFAERQNAAQQRVITAEER